MGLNGLPVEVNFSRALKEEEHDDGRAGAGPARIYRLTVRLAPADDHHPHHQAQRGGIGAVRVIGDDDGRPRARYVSALFRFLVRRSGRGPIPAPSST